jgi:hypothetical protein
VLLTLSAVLSLPAQSSSRSVGSHLVVLLSASGSSFCGVSA